MEDSARKYQAGLDCKKAEEALEAFLEESNDKAKVFAIKGDWGIGKTHLVKAFLANRKKEYHYASVFGVSTVDELKVKLWSNFKSDKQEKRVVPLAGG